MSLAREINERFTRIEQVLDTLKTNERGGVSGGAVPAPTAQYQHLEANVTPAWANVVNLTLPDDAHIGLPGAGGKLVFDLTSAPDQLKVTDADLNFVTTAHGIIHVDGVAAGMVLRANGTRYVPAVAAATLPIAPLAVGNTLVATAGPVWDILATPGAAGYARVSTATTEAWDQTPLWSGLAGFGAGLTILDDQPLNIGTGLETVIMYDEAGDDRTEVTGADWFFTSLIVNIGTAAGGGGERLAVREDQDAVTAGEIVNESGGTAAAAFMRMKNTAGASGAAGAHELGVGVLGTGFATSGIAFQDSAMIQAGSSLSGGLTIRTLAATPIVCGVNAGTEIWRADANGLTVPDDVYFNFGTGLDTRMRYDEAGDDRTEITGADWFFDTLDITMSSAVSLKPILTMENTNDDGLALSVQLYKNSAVPADDDNIAEIIWYANDSAGDKQEMVSILGEELDRSDAAEAGGLRFNVTMNHVSRQLLMLSGYNGTPDEGEFIVNEDGQNVDVRFEAVGQPNALTVRGSDGLVGVWTDAPGGTLHVHTFTSAATAAARADDLIVENGVGEGDVGISLLGAVDGFANILFGTSADNDVGGITYTFTGSDLLSFRVSAATRMTLSSTSLLLTTTLDLNGIADALILDTDADTTISAPTDDQIDIEIAGADDFTFTVNSFNVLAGSVITMADGATIGQAAGPLLTFDDSNNFLEITGCSVGVGVAAPTYLLEVAGTMGIDKYTYHNDDTNTYTAFDSDQWRVIAGGVTMIDANELSGSPDYLNFHAGLVGINETTNANMTIGLTIDQAANDDEALNVRSSDVGAVRSNLVETGTFFTASKSQGGSGGLALRAFKDNGGNNFGALQLSGYLEEDTDVAKTTAARGIVEIFGFQTDQTNNENTVANGNVLVIRTQRGAATVTTHWFDEDGDFGYDGSLVSYDHLEDGAMARDLQRVLTGRRGVYYNEDAMVEAGILHPSDDGRVMVSHKRMTALQLGAHAQAYEDRRGLEARIEYLEEQLRKVQ